MTQMCVGHQYAIHMVREIEVSIRSNTDDCKALREGHLGLKNDPHTSERLHDQRDP
jgi:hypothetical protein